MKDLVDMEFLARHNVDPYQQLAYAVVAQTVEDYKTAYRKNQKPTCSREDLKQLRSLKAFMRSDWFKSLSGVYNLDHKKFIAMVEDMAKEKNDD